jgi:uncharacterized membrane protein YidH (DUF202 family)
MKNRKFDRLVRRGILTGEQLEEAIRASSVPGAYPEETLIKQGVPKHEILFSLSEYYGCPFLEYDEGVVVSSQVIRKLDTERLKQAHWFPLSVGDDSATILAYDPQNPVVLRDIETTLGKHDLTFMFALPQDLVRIVENNQDLNPGFPPSAGRTALAKVRTALADRRSMLSCYRTALARGRTGLAFLRTGISFIMIALALYKIFGAGYQTIAEAVLFLIGAAVAADGFRWYLPARAIGRKKLHCVATGPTGGSSVLEVSHPGNDPVFTRTGIITGAEKLRAGWEDLSPVMRRRFLASDRTDLAEERTVLACLRTMMARARTGLAFTRTGVAFIGIGVALLRQFRADIWTSIGVALTLVGGIMVLEGFYWYVPGRRAGTEGLESVQRTEKSESIWDVVFPPTFKQTNASSVCAPAIKGFQSPGVWATTGLALERTLIAERRNVMARLRTVMARSRTGMAFIRTGMSISAVGLGLLVYFGASRAAWTAFDLVMILAGLALIVDGLYWHIPAEKTRKVFPYCFNEMEICIPDYGTTARQWKKAVFDNDHI